MMASNGRLDILRSFIHDILNGLLGRNMFHGHFEFGKLEREGFNDALDKGGFAFKDINGDGRHFGMYTEHHALVTECLQGRIAIGNIGDSVFRVGSGTRRIILCTRALVSVGFSIL